MLDPDETLVLLGAGASKPADLPLSTELTSTLVNRLGGTPWGEIIRFAVGCLQMSKGVQGQDPSGGVNVERLFNAIDLLERRQESEIAPFVNQWHPKIEQLEAQAKQLPIDERHISDAVSAIARLADASESRRRTESKRAAAELVKAVSEVNGISGARAFRDAKHMILKESARELWNQDNLDVDYLTPLVQWASANNTTIATLNYDNCIELACWKNRLKVTTGIDRWVEQGSFAKKPEGIELLKVHGSMNWAWAFRSGHRRTRSSIEELDDWDIFAGKGRDYEPAIVFGAGNKLTAQGPFLDLFSTFQERLFSSSKLFVVGYSFSDDHINEAIFTWFETKSDSEIVIVDAPGNDLDGHNFKKSYGSRYPNERVHFRFCGAEEAIGNSFEEEPT